MRSAIRIDHDATSAAAALARARLRVPVRPELPPGDAPRRPDPQARSASGRRSTCSARSRTRPGRRRQLLGVGDARGRRPVRRGRPSTRAPSGRSSSTAPASTSCRSTARASLYDVTEAGVEQRFVDAEALGLRPAATSKLAGGDAADERAVRRGRASRRARRAARRRAAQRRRGVPRRGRGRDARGRHRAGGADHRRRADRRAPRAAAGGADGGRGGAASRPRRRPRPGRRHDRRRPGAEPARRPNVVDEIAARRRDGPRGRARRAAAERRRARRRGPAPRPIVERLAAPGPAPHRRGQAVVAVGRADRATRRRTSSPGPARTRPAGPRRSRSCASRTGSAARSTTCARVRDAVAIPVLAKEFVVDARQLADRCARPGPTSVLLLAVLHPASAPGAARRRGRSSSGLEPLVEAHDERELEAALATDARLIGINNRDLRTLEVDTERADRLRDARARTTASSSPSRASATRRPSRAGGRSGSTRALVGEALMRARRPGGRRPRRSWRPAGQPDDPANVARRPFVKICGVTDAAGVAGGGRGRAPTRSGSTWSPGTPRALEVDEAAELAPWSSATPRRRARRPRIVARHRGRRRPSSSPRLTAADRPRRHPVQRRRAGRRVAGRCRDRAWKALHLPARRRPTGPRPPAATRRGGPRLPRRRRRADPRRHGRRAASRRHRRQCASRSSPPRSRARCRSSWPAA